VCILQLQALRKAKKLRPLPPFGEYAINKNRSALKEITPVIIGKYAVHLKEWLKYFPEHQILVLNGDKLISGESNCQYSTSRWHEKSLRTNVLKLTYISKRQAHFTQTTTNYRDAATAIVSTLRAQLF